MLSGSLRFHQKTTNDVQKQMLNAKSIGMYRAKPEASIEIQTRQKPLRVRLLTESGPRRTGCI